MGRGKGGISGGYGVASHAPEVFDYMGSGFGYGEALGFGFGDATGSGDGWQSEYNREVLTLCYSS